MAPSYIAVLNVYAVSHLPSLSTHSCPHMYPFWLSSFPTYMTSRGVPKVTTRSKQTSVPSPLRRTKRRLRLACPRKTRISTQHMKMPFMCWTQSRRRSNRHRMRVHSKRITIGVLGQSELFVGFLLIVPKDADGWIRRGCDPSVLLAWTLSNAFLGATITSLNDKDNGANATVLGYMTFLLGSVAGLACE